MAHIPQLGQREVANTTHHQLHNRCTVLSVQYAQRSLHTPYSPLSLLMWRIDNLSFSKDTFRWTFEQAKINFNRLKILIFPVNNQETFPVCGRANQTVWEEVRTVQKGI